MAHKRFGWHAVDLFVKTATDFDFLTMWDEDMAVMLPGRVIGFYKFWDGGDSEEPLSLVTLKKNFTARKINWIQLMGNNYTESDIAQAEFTNSLRGI